MGKRKNDRAKTEEEENGNLARAETGRGVIAADERAESEKGEFGEGILVI